MRFSDFNEYLEIYKLVDGEKNDYGESAQVEHLVIKQAAQVTFVRGDDKRDDGIAFPVQYVNFTTWHINGVDTSHYIIYKGKKYDILFIEPIRGNGVRYMTRVEPN